MAKIATEDSFEVISYSTFWIVRRYLLNLARLVLASICESVLFVLPDFQLLQLMLNRAFAECR